MYSIILYQNNDDDNEYPISQSNTDVKYCSLLKVFIRLKWKKRLLKKIFIAETFALKFVYGFTWMHDFSYQLEF